MGKYYPSVSGIASLIDIFSPLDVGLTDWESEFGDFLHDVCQFFPVNFDVNSGDPLGVNVCQVTARHGRRITASGAYLSDAPSNLTIITDVIVEKILFDHGKAVGVATNQGKNSKMNSRFCECCTLAEAQ